MSLETHRCLECNAEVRVPLIWPYEGVEKPTGIPLYYMDEYQDSHLFGALCFDCASHLYDEGVVAIGYSGFPHSWGACLEKPHSFHFMDENYIPCLCDACREEEDYEIFW